MPSTSTYYDDARSNPKVPDALGESEAFIAFQEQLSAVAKVDRPVLIVGERGTGKELAVSRLHYLSARWQGPLMALNCSSLNPSVVESELFGHEAGSFTGAMRRRTGRFEAAEGGTLFLDEVGLIPLEVQEKILRVVEYRQFERVGGSSPVRVDVRIIGATNANLPEMAASGRFKRDLLDRMSFEVLFLPSLRERRDDIPLLAQHFATRMAMELGRPGIPVFTDQAAERLQGYRWPGNIRELKNVVERAVYKSSDDLIEAQEIVFDPFVYPYGDDLQERPGFSEPSFSMPSVMERSSSGVIEARSGGGEFEPLNLAVAVRAFEVSAIRGALEAARYHQGEAASLLGLTYHQFRGYFRKYKKELGES